MKKTRRCRDAVAAAGGNNAKEAMRGGNDAEEGGEDEGNLRGESQVESGGRRTKGRRSKGERSMEEVGFHKMPSSLDCPLIQRQM